MIFRFLISRLFVLKLLLIFILGLEIFAQSETDLKIKIINDSDLKLLLEKGKGSAILINVWATWCEPCREEFPDLVVLSEKYKNNIRFILISVDDVTDLQSKVVPFLKSQNAQFENFLVNVIDPEDFINLLDKNWSGAVPATFIFDKYGKQTEALIGRQSFEMFENGIKKVID